MLHGEIVEWAPLEKDGVLSVQEGVVADDTTRTADLQRVVGKAPELRLGQGLLPVYPSAVPRPMHARPPHHLALRAVPPRPSHEERSSVAGRVPALATAEVGIGVIAGTADGALRNDVTDIEILGNRIDAFEPDLRGARRDVPQHRPAGRRIDLQRRSAHLLDRDVLQRQIIAVDDDAAPAR